MRAGDVEEGVQANPGLLMDEHEAWNLLGAYAEARSYEGATQPAANPNFKPSLVNPPTSAVLAAVVSNNAYTGTYVTLDQLTSTDEFNNWKSPSYNICLTWNNMTANIVMTVNEQTFTWPTEVGEYTVAFELSNGKQDADRQSAGAQVTMNVFARSSEDGTGPKPGDDEEQPQAGTNYVVFSDDFTVSVEERDNNTLTDEVLINHGNAVAYQKDNLYTPSGTVVVTDAAKQALKAAQPSDTIAVPFGVQEE